MRLEKIAILGLARSGIAAAYKIKNLGGTPFLSDLQPKEKISNAKFLLEDFDCEFGGHTQKLYDYDTFIVSPGIPLNSPIILELKKRNKKLISEIEFGYLIKEKKSKIIAITGSNGKSTTVSLVHHILQQAGLKSILAGNIGTAFTTFSIEKPGIDVIVLEISSFQLDLIDTFHPNIATVLNITPDHLNRYANLDFYSKSKFRIFMNQSENDASIINAEDTISKNMSKSFSKEWLRFGKSPLYDIYEKDGNIIHFSGNYSLANSKLLGYHNIQNTMAAILCITPFVQDRSIIQKAIDTFTPLEHRLEVFSRKKGVTFVNDSKATNSDSVKFALSAFTKPVRIIMGGSDKGEKFENLIPLLQEHAKKVYLIGETKKLMEKQFSTIVPYETFGSLRKSVKKAYQDASSEEIILLSPGCASYDMFKNFEDRGNQFKKIVEEL